VSPSRPGWRFDLGVLLAAWAFVFLLHPPPGFFWGEYPSVVYRMLSLPAGLDGLRAAIEWQATVHTPGLTRPMRAVQWWLAARLLGCDPFAYFVVNGLAVGIVAWAIARVTWHATGSLARGLAAGACASVSYVSVYSILPFFSFGVSAASAFGGLALSFGGERRGGRWRAPGGFLLLLVGGLAHETLLALALVPLAWAAIVRREGAAVRRALPYAAVVPAYVVTSWLLAAAYGTGGPVYLGVLRTLRDAAPLLVEFPLRVLFTLGTGGLPLDPLRAAPWLGEFQRLRDLALTPAGVATFVLALAPGLGLTALALAAARREAVARRRAAFCLVWVALGSLPLLLPFGVPEAFHLTGALGGVFLLWGEAWSALPRRRAVVALALLVLWAGIHGSARWALFHRDLPRMRASLDALHRVLAEADRADRSVGVLFFPVQFGGHYGMLPTVPPLYPASATAEGACRLGERQRGCLLAPSWVWRTLGPMPSPPGACLTDDGVRVGPLDAEARRRNERMRVMLGQRGAGWLTQPPSPVRTDEWRHLDVCPLPPPEPVEIGGRAFDLYRETAGAARLWYRYVLAPSPRLIPIGRCEDGRGAGKP